MSYTSSGPLLPETTQDPARGASCFGGPLLNTFPRLTSRWTRKEVRCQPGLSGQVTAKHSGRGTTSRGSGGRHGCALAGESAAAPHPLYRGGEPFRAAAEGGWVAGLPSPGKRISRPQHITSTAPGTIPGRRQGAAGDGSAAAPERGGRTTTAVAWRGPLNGGL